MQSWTQVIPDYQPKPKKVKINPNQQIIDYLTHKYARMKFKVWKDGTIYIISDMDVADWVSKQPSPRHELWNYTNQLTIKEKRINKEIKRLFFT